MCATRHLRYGLTSAALLPGLFGYTEAQECYWPDGSGAGSDKDYWGPCTSSGGPCCREREACLSNGFCFGGTFGTPYRGACTNKNWTGCQGLGNDVYSGTLANMFNCGAPYNNIGGEYWVGDTELTTPCRSGRRASFTPWPTADIGKVIRRPALSSSESVTTSSSDQTTFASSSALSATSASTFTVSSELVASSVNASSVAGTHQPGDSTASADRQSLALGAGLGVPLGMASLGFMAFLFWKLRQQKQKSIPYRDSTQAQKSRRERTIDQAARELSGGETGQEMWAENLREIPEIDSRQRHETGTYYP